MKVKSKMSCPVRKEDGSWTTIIKEFISAMSRMVSNGTKKAIGVFEIFGHLYLKKMTKCPLL